jgi:hypothetical protein
MKWPQAGVDEKLGQTHGKTMRRLVARPVAGGFAIACGNRR